MEPVWRGERLRLRDRGRGGDDGTRGFCALRLPSALRPPSFDMRLPSAGRPAPSIVRPVVHWCSPVAGSAPASAPLRPDKCWHNGWTLIIWPAVPAQIVAQVCPVCAGPAFWRTGAQTPHASRPDSKRQGASRGHGREVCVLEPKWLRASTGPSPTLLVGSTLPAPSTEIRSLSSDRNAKIN